MSITLEKVSKIFKNSFNKNIHSAVYDMNINVEKGSLVSILGPSGCGKSTTLFMIAGLISVSSGKIFFDDKEVTNLSVEKRGVGLVFQNYSLYPHMSVRQNITFPLKNLRKSKEEILTETENISKILRIEKYLDKKPSELSGGQQQRVAIARSLVKKPKVLLLDEPFSNLDFNLRLIMREEIRRIRRKTGVTIIFVTHDQEEAMCLSDQIYVMNQGIIEQKGLPQEVYNNPRTLFVSQFLGSPSISVFDGEIRKGNVMIGEDILFHIPKLKDINQEVYITIRPEGYIFDDRGIFTVRALGFENIGRELVLLAWHQKCLSDIFRIIFPYKESLSINIQTDQKKFIHFNIKQEKCFIFSKENEERIF